VAKNSMDLNKFPLTSVKGILNYFNCGREGHVARNCQRRLTHKDSVGRDTQCKASVSRDAQPRGGVSRNTDKLNRAQGKGRIRSGNDGSCRATQQLPAETSKRLFTIECEEHCNSRQDTVKVGVYQGRTEKLGFLIDTRAEISV